jgi:hypothetical protein
MVSNGRGNIVADYVKRLAACKSWQWMLGMVDTAGYRVVEEGPVEDVYMWACILEDGTGRLYTAEVGDSVPDITDPATRGCLEVQVQERFKGNWYMHCYASQQALVIPIEEIILRALENLGCGEVE